MPIYANEGADKNRMALLSSMLYAVPSCVADGIKPCNCRSVRANGLTLGAHGIALQCTNRFAFSAPSFTNSSLTTGVVAQSILPHVMDVFKVICIGKEVSIVQTFRFREKLDAKQMRAPWHATEQFLQFKLRGRSVSNIAQVSIDMCLNDVV